MAVPSSTIRVVVRLPCNRPDDALPDPPPVEWNPEKERILWEVIAKSRAVEGSATDWKGLAAHLQVPLPYLLHRAQTRYEEDLRGLQGIRGLLSPISAYPVSAFPLSAVSNHTNEYFPRIPDQARVASPSVATRNLGVRARLSSLGRASPSAHGPTSAALSQRAKKVSSSSTITLQGSRRRSPPRPLSPASSRGSGSDSTHNAGGSEDADSSEDEEEEAARREEEEGRRAEAQDALDRKLRDLQRALTKDQVGLVAAPLPSASLRISSASLSRGRTQPLSTSSASVDSRARSRQSLSSASSPQGSIPSLPSPPPHARAPARHLARALSPPGQYKSVSPPALSPRSAIGQTVRAAGASPGSTHAGGRVSGHGSEASSFSDLSDASLSGSALESALMSNSRVGGSRFSSFARSNFTGRRNNAR